MPCEGCPNSHVGWPRNVAFTEPATSHNLGLCLRREDQKRVDYRCDIEPEVEFRSNPESWRLLIEVNSPELEAESGAYFFGRRTKKRTAKVDMATTMSEPRVTLAT